MKLERLLFASIHGYLDPSNGASTASRDLLELLSEARGRLPGAVDGHTRLPRGNAARKGAGPAPQHIGTQERQNGRSASRRKPEATAAQPVTTVSAVSD